MPVVSLEIGGNDKQETREGYNILKVTRDNFTENGITFTNNKDGSFTLNGTNTNSSDIYIDLINHVETANEYFTLTKNKKYYIYLKGRKTGVNLCIRGGATTSNISISTDTISSIKEWTIDTNEKGYGFISISSGLTFNNETFYPMLAKSDVELPYEPYGAMPSPEYPSDVECVGSNISTFDLANYLNEQEFETSQDGWFGFAKLPDNFKSKIRMNATEINKKTGLAFGLIEAKSETISTDIRVLQTDGTIQERVYDFSNSESVYFFIADTSKFKQEDLDTILANYNIEITSCTEIVVSNKNFFNKDTMKMTKAFLNYDTTAKENFKLIEAGNDSYICYIIPLPKAIRDFTISAKTFGNRGIGCGFVEYPKLNMEADQYFFSNSNFKGGSYTANADINYVMLFVCNDGVEPVNLMLEAGDTATEYIEHAEQTKIVDIQQEMLEGDYFVKEEDGWKEVHLWNKKIFDGTENISITNNGNSFSYIVSDILANTNINKVSEIFSNCYRASSWNDRNTYNTPDTISYYNIAVGIYKGDFATVEEFKADLAQKYTEGNPVYFWYKLATPTKLACTEKQNKQLEDLLNTSTYKNVTHIYSTDKVSPVIKIKYRKDITTLLNNQQSEYETRLSNIEKLLTTTTTSAMLLDNLQSDLEKEVL